FTRDNNCTIEFDAFGFSAKDYLTRHILLRCDSSGDLYPVTKPSTPPIAFLSTSASTWLPRLGHLGKAMNWWRNMVVPIRRVWLAVAGRVKPRDNDYWKMSVDCIELSTSKIFVSGTPSAYAVCCISVILVVIICLANVDDGSSAKMENLMSILHSSYSAGLLKLHDDVQTCGYEDVQVMYEMLRITESGLMSRASN
ncbi:hypothetical protein Tco_1509069, partial [Tanacetum coccineum]